MPRLTSAAVCMLSGLMTCPASLGAEGVDLDALVARARSVLEADLAAWAEYAFERRVRRERLDKEGIAFWREEYVFEVVPTVDGFDERLVLLNHRPPSEREVEKHRQAGRFEKHYREAVAARLRNPLGEDLPMQPLIFDQEHRYVGREVVAGIACHRVAFDARPEPATATVASRLKHAARGTLCLSEEGTHVVEAEVESVRSVRYPPLRLDHLGLRFESRPEGGVWLPRLFETSTEFKLGFRQRRTRNRYQYLEYRRPGGR